jgi:putative transposase
VGCTYSSAGSGGSALPCEPLSCRGGLRRPRTEIAEPAADPWAGDRRRLDRQHRQTYARGPVLLALLYAFLRLLVDLLVVRGRSSADRDLELLVLRQELLVLRRTVRRPRWRRADRMIVAALGRKLPPSPLLLVQPATILGWHRALVCRRWAAFGRRRGPGRPQLPAECQELVLRLVTENPLWGYLRIRGELLKLGHRVSATSVRNVLRRHRIPPAPRRAPVTWRRFLRAHGRAILACDYFTVDTVFLKRLYVLVFLELASRRVVFTACGEHPGGGWAAQQARNLAWELQEAESKPRFLIHDRDSNFPAAFDAVFRAEGLEVIRTPVRAPNANARCERWISSARRECLDWLLIVGRRQLEAVLAEYVDHYNGFRPHRSLGLLPPRGSPALPAEGGGRVVCRTRLDGLINEYSRQAA